MKKFVSVLCVLSMVLGMLGGVFTGRIIAVRADDSFPATVTVAGWSDPGVYDEAEKYAQVKVSAGAENSMNVGGSSFWSYGYILAEPKEGYELKSASYLPNGDIIDISEKITTLSAFKDSFTNTNTPAAVQSDLDSHSSNAGTVKAILVDRAFYEKICYIQGRAPVYLVFCNKQNPDQTYTFTINFQYDTFQSNTGINVGDTIDLISFWKDHEPAHAQDRNHDLFNDGVSTFDISDYSISCDFTDAMRRAAGADCAYTAQKAGSFDIELENLITGLVYEVFIYVADPGAPIRLDDIDAGELEVLPFLNDDSSLEYYVQPKEGNGYFTKHAEISFELPQAASGSAIVWSKSYFYEQPLTEGQTVETGSGATTLTGKMEGERAVFVLDSRKEIYYTVFSVCVAYNEKEYTYTFMVRTRPMFTHIGFHGFKSYPIRPYEKKALSDYVHIEDSAVDEKNLLYQKLESGELYFSSDSIIPLFDNKGKFTGYVQFTGPVSWMSFVDKSTGYGVLNGDMNIYFRMSTVVTSGTRLNLTDLLNGFTGEYCTVEVLKKTGNDWTAYGTVGEDRIFTAPAVTDKETFIVRYENTGENIYEAVVNIVVVPDAAYEEAVCGELASLEENGTLTLCEELSNSTISVEILKALKQSEDGTQLVIENADSTDKIEWVFSSDLLTAEDSAFKDIDLSTNVGTADSTLTGILEENDIDGVPVQFADNGKLPGTVTVRLYLTDEQVAKVTDKNNVRLYYQDGTELKLYKSGLQLVFDKAKDSYFVEIEVDHNSTFLITSADKESYTKSAETGGTTTEGETTTGGTTTEGETTTGGTTTEGETTTGGTTTGGTTTGGTTTGGTTTGGTTTGGTTTGGTTTGGTTTGGTTTGGTTTGGTTTGGTTTGGTTTGGTTTGGTTTSGTTTGGTTTGGTTTGGTTTGNTTTDTPADTGSADKPSEEEAATGTILDFLSSEGEDSEKLEEEIKDLSTEDILRKVLGEEETENAAKALIGGGEPGILDSISEDARIKDASSKSRTNKNGTTTDTLSLTLSDNTRISHAVTGNLDGSVTTKDTVKSPDGSKAVKTVKEQENGDMSATTVFTNPDGSKITVKESRKTNDETGVTTEKKTQTNPDGSIEKTTVKTEENNDYKATRTVKDADGNTVEKQTATRETSEDNSKITEALTVKNAEGTLTRETTTSLNKYRETESVALREKSADGTAMSLTVGVNEDGTGSLKGLEGTSSALTIPELITDGNGNDIAITALEAGSLADPKAVQSLNAENISTIRKNALSGAENLTELFVGRKTVFEKNSLKKTSENLTIFTPKNIKSKELKSMKKQLKKCGNKTLELKKLSK